MNYEAMIDLCVEEIKDIHFIGIRLEEMQIVWASLKEHFDASGTIPDTRKSHHFIPQTKTNLLHKLTSEYNTSLFFDFNLNIFEQTDLV